MSLFIASINSGSNGNCYYVGNRHEAVIIDAGISCREIVKRMNRLSLDISKVRAIFISHEHSDHIRGVEVLSRKYCLPVYITGQTLGNSRLQLNPGQTFNFQHNVPVTVGSLTVLPFRKSHDAADPHSFVVSGNGLNVGVMTDIGYSCGHVIERFRECHAVFLESNYDEQMLHEGPYPYYLKKRISSDAGHLSNRQALELYRTYRHEQLQHLVLTHLSRENNSPQLVHKLFAEHSNGHTVLVASRDYETEVLQVFSGADDEPVLAAGAEEIQVDLFSSGEIE